MTPIPEAPDADLETFRDIRRAGEPVVLRGLVADWPLVQAALAGEAAEWLKAQASPEPVPYMRAGPETGGRLHYGRAVGGVNFTRAEAALADYLDLLAAEADKERPDSLALQGMPASERLPDFARLNPMPLLPEAIIPRLWIGNRAEVAIHHDPSENIACVAAGRRRFTLFPPEQVVDLYMGPFHETPAGTQVSLVHLTDPDLERFPRFPAALRAALTAELGPGDALYIPFHWYHHVQALEPFNVLVNYWWDPAPAHAGSPWDAMLHGLASLSALPRDQRRAWRAMFDHYVFRLDHDPAAHLPPDRKGVLSPPTPEQTRRLREALKQRLK